MERSQNRLESVRRAMYALGEPHRFELVRRLMSGPTSVNVLAEAIGRPQPLVSHHLKVLHEAGIVAVVRSGKFRLYQVDSKPDAAVAPILDHLRECLREGVEASPRSIASEISEIEDFLL